MTSDTIASTTWIMRKPVGWLPFHDRESALMFLIKVTQMIHDQMANAIKSQEARRDSRMPSRLPLAAWTSYAR